MMLKRRLSMSVVKTIFKIMIVLYILGYMAYGNLPPAVAFLLILVFIILVIDGLFTKKKKNLSGEEKPDADDGQYHNDFSKVPAAPVDSSTTPPLPFSYPADVMHPFQEYEENLRKELDQTDDMTETVKNIYAALNDNDVSTYLSFFDEKVKRFETFGSRCHGLVELKANFSQGRGSWAEGSCGPEKFIVLENKVVVFVHVRVRLKNKDEWIDGQVTDVFLFQGPKVVEFNSFSDRNEALQWAGIEKGKY